jgi:glyoxylase-like metal-dependent hydrolase (beta-lactamase superfamily II)
MRIHALLTGAVQLPHQRRARPRLSAREVAPVYAWAIEHDEGLIVVDTGPSEHSSRRAGWPAWTRLGRSRRAHANVTARLGIGQRLVAHGLAPSDVRWVVLTQLDPEHAGGLGRFPASDVLVSEQELAAATRRRGLSGDARDLSSRARRPIAIDFYRDRSAGPFELSYPLTRDSDIRLVPTPGRTPGHLSVVAEGATRTVVIAGDASYTEQELIDTELQGAAWDRRAAEESLRRLRAYCAGTGAVYLPSHDPRSGHRLRDGIVAFPAVDADSERLERAMRPAFEPAGRAS